MRFASHNFVRKQLKLALFGLQGHLHQDYNLYASTQARMQSDLDAMQTLATSVRTSLTRRRLRSLLHNLHGHRDTYSLQRIW